MAHSEPMKPQGQCCICGCNLRGDARITARTCWSCYPNLPPSLSFPNLNEAPHPILPIPTKCLGLEDLVPYPVSKSFDN
jgi:hypothetical protein